MDRQNDGWMVVTDGEEEEWCGGNMVVFERRFGSWWRQKVS